MVHLPAETWVAIGTVIIGAVFAALRSLAAHVKTLAAEDELRERVIELRKQLAERLALQASGITPIDDANPRARQRARGTPRKAA